MDCEFSFFSATSHFLRHSLSLPLSPSPSHLEPPSLSISSSIPSTLLAAAAEAVVENKSKWRGHCPNHLAAVGFLLAMHTYVMPCSTWVGTGVPSGGRQGGTDDGKRYRGGANGKVSTRAFKQLTLVLSCRALFGRSILRHEQWRQSAENGTK